MEENTNKQINISPDSEERKLARKKRRRNTTIISFLFIIVVVAVLAGAGVFLGRLIVKSISNRPVREVTSVSVSNETQEVISSIEEIIGSEDIVSVEDPDIIDVPSEEELYESWLKEKIDALTLEEKILGLFIVTPEQITGATNVTRAGDSTKAALEKYAVGGIVYSASNIESSDQFKTMLENTASFVKYETFFVLNEEPGNTVLANKLKLSETSTAASLGETMDPYKAYDAHAEIAKYLKTYGINLNLGLVSDVLYSSNEEEEIEYFMALRAYGSDPTIVARMVTESVKAYNEAGISVATGYFPGQGSVSSDPSASVVTTDITKDQVLSYQLPVYEAAVEGGVNAIIVSHEYAENLTSDNLPCSLSKEIYTDLLREEMGFKDVVLVTDALDKTAVADYYTAEEACVKALKAGADMVMCPENFEEGYKGVLAAVESGVISEERINDSLMRVWKVKYREIYNNEMQLGTDSEAENTETSEADTEAAVEGND